MKAYCSKCNINWGALQSQDDGARDETYHFCPKCKNDMFLQDVQNGPQYIMNMLNGKVIDIKTREELLPASPVSKNFKPTKPFDVEQWRVERELKEDNILIALDAYQEAYRTGGQVAGEAAYYQKIKDLNQ